MHVEIDHITKTFGPLRANDDISTTLEGGRIYGILGENGAGKSTLMKILSGYQPADSGRIMLDGKQVAFKTPADALAVGIGMLHQDPLDVPNLTVLENFMLGGGSDLIPNRAQARAAFLRQAATLGFALNPDSYIDNLTIGERQQLEIVRLLSLGAQVLILDEPTTGISAEQKDVLFASLKNLAANNGLMVILVSHKLEDVAALCDEVYILRAGKVVGQRQMPTPIPELVALMFGQTIERPARAPHTQERNVTLSIHDASIPDRRFVVHGVTLDVHAGEVIGLAGLDGSGQRALLRACARLQPLNRGRITFCDQDVTRNGYHDLVRRGMAYAPAGRLEEGLIEGLTLSEHFALAMPEAGSLWIDWKTVTNHALKSVTHYNIRGRPESQIQTLSGGNQQRALIALLPQNLKLLLLEEPTRGLDVESARWVWQQLLERRASGTAIIFLSPDLDEIVQYSDRVVVFFGGQTTIVNDLDQTPASRLGGLIGGKA